MNIIINSIAVRMQTHTHSTRTQYNVNPTILLYYCHDYSNYIIILYLGTREIEGKRERERERKVEGKANLHTANSPPNAHAKQNETTILLLM